MVKIKPLDATQTSGLKNLKGYYRWQSRIYDFTRWTFLFGRKDLVNQAQRLNPNSCNILEIGCGTGQNLQLLRKKFPEARLTGSELSEHMLAKAKSKTSLKSNSVELIGGDYLTHDLLPASYDIILISYVLTMVPQLREQILKKSIAELAPGGLLLVVDFHNSQFPVFRKWMLKNHVTMDNSLLHELKKSGLKQEFLVEKSAYLGLWKYLSFAGSRVH